MKRLWKEVNGSKVYRLEGSHINKAAQIACKRCWIAGNIGDCTGGLLQEPVYDLRGKACSWGIDHNDIGIGIGKSPPCIAADGIDILEASVLKVAPQVTYGRAV